MLKKLAIVLFFMALVMSWIISVEHENIKNDITACGYIDEIENLEMS
jgi:hypothetical protein